LYNARVLDSLRVRFLRFAFHHFYNSFAWTYDGVSYVVSLGHWREWTRAAIPHIRGKRVLEIAFGTGNLQLDLRAAGIAPYGLDLSPNMIRITLGKLRRAGHQPRLLRGTVLRLPFADGAFDSLVLTFPPGFLRVPQAVREMSRVLAHDGQLVVVDSGWIRQPTIIGVLINLAFRFTGTTDIGIDHLAWLHKIGFETQIFQIGDERSAVQVLVARRSSFVASR
jgi:ubiquinone/menaquinone biosynthesis C-methylase UbiE